MHLGLLSVASNADNAEGCVHHNIYSSCLQQRFLVVGAAGYH